MPKSFVELAQGNVFTRSSEGGSSVDSAQRQFKVILETPDEPWNVDEYIGISIGDPYSETNQIPCVSFEGRADGDSRLVRIVTFRYRATPGGVDGSGEEGVDSDVGSGVGSDPRLQPPASRPALYQLSSSLQEVPAVGGGVLLQDGFTQKPAFVTPTGELQEGITKLEPVVNLQITQYSYTDKCNLLRYTGYVNEDQFSFSGHTVPVHCCMFNGLNVSPYVESGFRGFQLQFHFSFRWNQCSGVEYNELNPLGWDQAVVLSGYNILNTGLGLSGVEQEHLLYKLDDDESGFLAEPLALGRPNQKVRAQIPGQADSSGRMRQHASASPVLLNKDGSPRARSLPPLVYRYQTQPHILFGDNFSQFGINRFF